MLIERQHNSISWEASAKLALAACQHAIKLRCCIAVAIVDDSGNEKAFSKMDSVPLLGAENAHRAAFTSLLGIPTGNLLSNFARQKNIATTLPFMDKVSFIAGGFPIISEGQIIGGIGVGGASELEDTDCAVHALREIGIEVDPDYVREYLKNVDFDSEDVRNPLGTAIGAAIAAEKSAKRH